jgi:hypothetical protein
LHPQRPWSITRSSGAPQKADRQRAALAQLVEHRIRNAGVRCSSHLSGTNKINRLASALHQCGAFLVIPWQSRPRGYRLGSTLSFPRVAFVRVQGNWHRVATAPVVSAPVVSAPVVSAPVVSAKARFEDLARPAPGSPPRPHHAQAAHANGTMPAPQSAATPRPTDHRLARSPRPKPKPPRFPTPHGDLLKGYHVPHTSGEGSPAAPPPDSESIGEDQGCMLR